jgi:uncharacterized protein (DUF2062 family)
LRQLFRRIKEALVVGQASPRLRAASLAAGIALAFSPFPGFHLLFIVILARTTQLNGLLLFLGSLLHNPWSMVFIHGAGLLVGDLILSGEWRSWQGVNQLPLGDFSFLAPFNSTFWQESWPHLKPMLASFLLGSTLISAIAGTLSYLILIHLFFPRWQRPAN